MAISLYFGKSSFTPSTFKEIASPSIRNPPRFHSGSCYSGSQRHINTEKGGPILRQACPEWSGVESRGSGQAGRPHTLQFTTYEHNTSSSSMLTSRDFSAPGKSGAQEESETARICPVSARCWKISPNLSLFGPPGAK